MQDQLLNSGKDTLLLGSLLLLTLFAVYFRLDELFFRPKRKPARERPKTATVRKGVSFVREEDDYLRPATSSQDGQKIILPR